MDGQKFCLRWDGFQSSVTSLFDSLRRDSELVDITLCCEGRQVRAHRMMLSACSPYFRELFKDLPCQQMVIFLKDTSAADLTAVVEFMYKGSVNVAQSQLASFIKTAEMLQVQGLSGGDDKEPPASPPPPPPPPEPTGGWIAPPSPSPAAPLRRATADTADSPRPKRRRQAESGASPPREAAGAPEAPGAAAVAPPPPPAGEFEGAVKVEKFDVDLTLDDNSGEPDTGEELEAALGHVAHYEGFDPGSDHSLGADGQMPAGDGALASNAAGSGGPYTPGPSQRTGEDAGQGTFTCEICGAEYPERRRLTEHFKKHVGKTTCLLCRGQFATMYGLRRHMLFRHKLSQQEVDSLTAKKGTPQL